MTGGGEVNPQHHKAGVGEQETRNAYRTSSAPRLSKTLLFKAKFAKPQSHSTAILSVLELALAPALIRLSLYWFEAAV